MSSMLARVLTLSLTFAMVTSAETGVYEFEFAAFSRTPNECGYTEALHTGVYRSKWADYACINGKEANRCRSDLYDKCGEAEEEAKKAAFTKVGLTEQEFTDAFFCAFEALERAGDWRDTTEVGYEELTKADKCGYTETLHEETVAATKTYLQCFKIKDDEECTRECDEKKQKALADTFNASNITAEEWDKIDSCAFETISTSKGSVK